MSRDLSVVILAFNEEQNINAAIDSVLNTIKELVGQYEIIIIDDGSTDRTGEIAQARAKANPHIRVLKNETNQGYGNSLARGIQSATKNYVSVFPGDNDVDPATFKDLFQEINGVDLVISYVANSDARSLFRNFLSRSFVLLLNAIFGMRLRYFNGPFLYKRAIVQSFPIKSTGFAVIAECNIRMIKAGYRYKEIGIYHAGRKSGRSQAVSWKSVVTSLQTIWILIQVIYLDRRQKPSVVPVSTQK